MPDSIRDGTGASTLLKITSDNRMMGEVITELISSERSRQGKLWGLGTGGLTPTASFSTGAVLWLQNNSTKNDWYVQKIIFGWNGGSTTWIKTVFSLISYNVSVPTGDNTAITAAIENISKSGSAAAVTNDDFVGHKWDGTRS